MREAGMIGDVPDRTRLGFHEGANHRREARAIRQPEIAIGLFHVAVEQLDEMPQQGAESAIGRRCLHAAKYNTAVISRARKKRDAPRGASRDDHVSPD